MMIRCWAVFSRTVLFNYTSKEYFIILSPETAIVKYHTNFVLFFDIIHQSLFFKAECSMAIKKQKSVGFTKITLLICYPAAGEFELEAVLVMICYTVVSLCAVFLLGLGTN